MVKLISCGLGLILALFLFCDLFLYSSYLEHLYLHFLFAFAILYLASVKAWALRVIGAVGLVWLWVGAQITLSKDHSKIIKSSYRLHDQKSSFIKTKDRPDLKVMSFNLWHQRIDKDLALKSIASNQPDIFVINEPGEKFEREMFKELYPYELSCRRHIKCSMVILSKLPLTNKAIILKQQSQSLILSGTIEFGGQKLTIVGIDAHAPSPLKSQKAEFAHLAKILVQLPNPKIVAGDFNAARHSFIFGDLLKQADLYAPFKLMATWPSIALYAGFEIDHILISPSLNFSSKSFGSSIWSSDHRAIVAEIRLQ